MKLRALLSMLALLLASSAAAQTESPRELLDRALALRERGEDEEALALFRRAHALEPSAQTLGQIALAEQALGRFREAERDLIAALEQGGPWIEQYRAALGEALETIRGHLGTLELTGGVDGAEVRVNGEAVGVLPLPPISVEAGVAIVEVSAEGFLPYQRQLEIAPRERARREVALVPRPEASPSRGATAETTVMGSRPEPPAPVAHGPDDGLIAGTVVAFTLAAAGVAIFAGAGAAAQGEYDGLATGCGATMACTEADVASLRSLSLAADLGLGIGAAALVLGAVMVGVLVASGERGATARLEVGPGGVSLRGAF
jgi:hypothetical protein